MFKKNDTKDIRWVIWISSGLRCLLGLLFIALGFVDRKEEGAWFLMIFGLILIVTGFIRPRRCVDDSCKP